MCSSLKFEKKRKLLKNFHMREKKEEEEAAWKISSWNIQLQITHNPAPPDSFTLVKAVAVLPPELATESQAEKKKKKEKRYVMTGSQHCGKSLRVKITGTTFKKNPCLWFCWCCCHESNEKDNKLFLLVM